MKTTIFLPISRPDNLHSMISQISKLRVDTHEVDFIIVADNKRITHQMINRAINLYKCEKKFVGLYHTGLNAVPEGNIAKRRVRISEVFNLARKHIPEDSDLVFVMEDDTLAQPNAYLNLYATYKSLVEASQKRGTMKIGLVSGLQVGRWGFRMLGAWRTNEFETINGEKTIETIPFARDRIIEKIDATGLYCFIVARDLFVNAQFKVDYFGCDVNFGLDLRRQGYQNFIDWTVQTGHLTPAGALYPDEKVIVVKYTKQGNREWERVAP